MLIHDPRFICTEGREIIIKKKISSYAFSNCNFKSTRKYGTPTPSISLNLSTVHVPELGPAEELGP